ncbi:unnamed protein product [Tuber melanosporum]|uniref:(Perigord truffle) hypothetical protein n=1 Tax=Tuber melanosporum (strain Mel28) TaxID=656061 RepID=D5GD64_TUBMM|nr:uncharacterized protein GSTUM_00006061001 [Tuber melanosporum]CAZ82457.1 unnamed protein product [Tuber melanosporum]
MPPIPGEHWKFYYILICFFAFNSLQMSLFFVLSEGVLSSCNPPVRKSAFQPFDRFLIQPPLPCNIGWKQRDRAD